MGVLATGVAEGAAGRCLSTAQPEYANGAGDESTK
jgi:hypothetical protein